MNFKRIISLLMVSALLCGAMAMTSCGSGEGENSSQPQSQPSEMTYKVILKDNLGDPFTAGAVVKFLKDGEQIAMLPCDSNGTVSKTMATGEYKVELGFTEGDSAYRYDANLVLTAEKNELEVVLAKKINSQPQVVVAQGNEYDAYKIGVGCTYVELKAGERNYFLFSPTTSGNYEFSIPEGATAKIGYYGGTHYIQENSAVEVVDNKFTISISDGSINTNDGTAAVFVIGVDSPDEKTLDCVIGIKRIGDPIKTIEDYPWDIYKKTVELKEYDLPEGYEIKEFDLTASADTYNLVFNETDGFYHLDSVDGPLVLVRLDEDCDYIDCYGTILEYTGVVKYFYDDEGNFVKKENYSNCLLEYLECVDLDEGVYPLTEDLKYIIQQNGDHLGWWKPDHSGYLFEDENGYALPEINNEIAWLLMCCYID